MGATYENRKHTRNCGNHGAVVGGVTNTQLSASQKLTGNAN